MKLHIDDIKEYIHDELNYDDTSFQLVHNILMYAKEIKDNDEQYNFLCRMLPIEEGVMKDSFY